jgi:hypothetical protein
MYGVPGIRQEIDMKKRWMAVVACLSLAAGIIVGAYVGVRFWQHMDATFLETRLIADAKMRLAVLEAIKNSKQENAVLLLESLLDGDVLAIDAIFEASSCKAELCDILSRVSRYRAQGNYRSSEEQMASAVERSLKHAAEP